MNEMKDMRCDMKKRTLNEQAKEILRQAEESGLQSNYFFVTTFERYQVQLQILEELQKVINSEGMLVTKEYVKGRQNLVANPAITEYNKTATAANGTVSTLINIIKTLSNEDEGAGKLASLMEMISDE